MTSSQGHFLGGLPRRIDQWRGCRTAAFAAAIGLMAGNEEGFGVTLGVDA
jgi:hypothetical protein